MKQTLIFGLLPIGLLAFAGIANAQMGMMGGYTQNASQVQTAPSEEIDTVLQSIYASQNLTGQSEVDCSKVSDEQFESLGDAYMGTMIPNEQQHEAMDTMMGGEGSASLQQAHINMGRSYLGCWSDYSSGPVYMPMMGGLGMMNGSGLPNGPMAWNGMMGSYYGSYGWTNWITTVLLWAFLASGVAAFIRWFRK